MIQSESHLIKVPVDMVIENARFVGDFEVKCEMFIDTNSDYELVDAEIQSEEDIIFFEGDVYKDGKDFCISNNDDEAWYNTMHDKLKAKIYKDNSLERLIVAKLDNYYRQIRF